MPKRLLLIRPGHAVGDAIFCTAAPRYLANEDYEVDVAVMPHNKDVFANNPYVHNIVDIPDCDNDKWREWIDSKDKEYDRVINVSGHVEVNMLYKTDCTWGDIPSAVERREKAKDANYYDVIFKECGISVPEGEEIRPEFYFTDTEKEQLAKVEEYKVENKEKLVIWQTSGSSKSKSLVYMPLWIQDVAKRIPNSHHMVLSHDAGMRNSLPIDNQRIQDVWGKWSIRNTIAMSSVADLVVGPESLLVNAAGAFETPKVIFFSHSAPMNLAKHYKNCYAITPDIPCHPCYLIHVDFRTVFRSEARNICRRYEMECVVNHPKYKYKKLGYKCCVHLPHDAVVDSISSLLKGKPKKKKKESKNV